MSDPRIASLVPSATEIVAALGCAESIVARSHECDWPPQVAQAPACTRARIDARQPSGAIHEEVGKLLAAALSLYDLDTEVLRAARPSHIVTQDQCDVCAVGLPEVEAAAAAFLEAPVQIVSLAPMRLGDVWDDIGRVGAALGVDAASVRAGLRERVTAIAERAKALPAQARPHRRVERPAHDRRQLGAGAGLARGRDRHPGRRRQPLATDYRRRGGRGRPRRDRAHALRLRPAAHGRRRPRPAGRSGLERLARRAGPARSTPPTATPTSTGRGHGWSNPSKSWPKSSTRRTSASATKAPGGAA